MNYIGIDNGVSGAFAILVEGEEPQFFATPIFSELNYTKEKKNINRVDRKVVIQRLADAVNAQGASNFRAFIERPMVNPGRFAATISAIRALEATLCVLEDLGISLEYIDSRQWQKVMLPSGLKGADELKSASLDIGTRLFPQFRAEIKKQKDADALLIAEWARRSKL